MHDFKVVIDEYTDNPITAQCTIILLVAVPPMGIISEWGSQISL